MNNQDWVGLICLIGLAWASLATLIFSGGIFMFFANFISSILILGFIVTFILEGKK